jgi:16S rRNA (cytosine967-C5)-methyltransferase
LSSKKLFDGGNSGQTEHNHVKETGSEFIKSINPRQLSYFILSQYFSEKSNLKFLLNNSLKKYPLSELDRRFVFEVVKGTVRYVIRIDFLISLFSNKTIKSLDRDVLNILRQAVYQMLYMDKTPAYAAINESVELAKRHIGTYSSRFVNAVLRKLNTVPAIQDFLDKSIKNVCIKPVQRLSVMYSYPEWLVGCWLNAYGADKTESLLNLLNHEPTVFIRVNRLKTDKIKLINIFKESGMLEGRDFFPEPLDNIETADSGEITAATAGNIIPGDTNEITSGTAGRIGSFKKTGLFDDCIILKSVQNIEKIPGYLQGHFSVQDFSSQFAVKYFLDPTKHDRILDICSAPGGKATYMAELTDDNAEILSVDINTEKMDLLKENIARLGIKNIFFVNADATETDFLKQDKFEYYFDKIFIDAPCSAWGTISKNPDAKYTNTLSDTERLAEITEKILFAADKYLKPGGIIILYKCTLSKTENQESVKRFVQQNPDKYSICQPFSGYTDISGSDGGLKQDSCTDKDYRIKKANMLMLETYLKQFNKKGPFFEIMPDYFSSEAGFICILKKSV